MQRAKLGAHAPETPPESAPERERISIEDFARVELRTGRIVSAERVPKSNKLIKLIVNLGSQERQIVAGIGKHYSPDELIGLDVVIVANLAPARLMGVESNGMLLAASNGEQLVIVSPRGEIPPGSVVR